MLLLTPFPDHKKSQKIPIYIFSPSIFIYVIKNYVKIVYIKKKTKNKVFYKLSCIVPYYNVNIHQNEHDNNNIYLSLSIILPVPLYHLINYIILYVYTFHTIINLMLYISSMLRWFKFL
jgi:hypothetical protein